DPSPAEDIPRGTEGTGDRAGRRAGRLPQPVRLELLPESGAAHAQRRGGTGAVPLRLLQRPADDLPLGVRIGCLVAARSLARAPLGGGLRVLAALDDLRGEVAGEDAPALADDARVLDRGHQLADVSRPVVRLQELQRLLGAAGHAAIRGADRFVP